MVRSPTFLLSLPDGYKMRNFMKKELHYDVQFLILHFKVGYDTPLAWLSFCCFKSDPEKFSFQARVFFLPSLLEHPS